MNLEDLLLAISFAGVTEGAIDAAGRNLYFPKLPVLRKQRREVSAVGEGPGDIHTTTMKKKKVRYGIIGYGGFAERAVGPAIRNTENSELVAIHKRSLDDARRKAREFTIPYAFDSAHDLAVHPDVDAVFISSANADHCEHTVIAAQAGKHVLLEKPMAMCEREAERMIISCASAHVRLMVGHMIRFSPLVQRIRDHIGAGTIGRVIAARADFAFDATTSPRTWIFDRALAGSGPVFDVGVHCLDTLRYVLDDEVATVSAELSPLPTAARTEESAQIALTFAKGTIGSIFCSFVAPVRRSFIRITGTNGILSAEDFTQGARTLELTFQQGRGGVLAGLSTERVEVPNLYVEEITHFSDCIMNDSEHLSPGENGLRNQRVLDAVLESRGQNLK